MKSMIAAAALGALALSAGVAQGAEFVTVPLETTVAAPADAAWKKLSDFCDIGAWMKISCVYTSGSGEVGSVRLLRGTVTELMVAKTARSYTYSQPKSPINYHGTVEMRPIDKAHSRLLYTLVYDAEPLATPEAKAADKASRAKRFNEVLAVMKGIAEAK